MENIDKLSSNLIEKFKWKRLKEFIINQREIDRQQYDKTKMPHFSYFITIENLILKKMTELEIEYK